MNIDTAQLKTHAAPLKMHAPQEKGDAAPLKTPGHQLKTDPPKLKMDSPQQTLDGRPHRVCPKIESAPADASLSCISSSGGSREHRCKALLQGSEKL